MLPETATSAPEPSPPSPAAAGAKGEGKRGGPNHVTHGLYGSGLPRGAQRVGRRLNEFRRSLCEAVEARAGEIDLHAAATIDSAAQWQRHALLAARWLRLEHDKLAPADRLAFSREVAKASTERDRCIRLLGLQQPATAFDAARAYDEPITLADVPEAATHAVAALADHSGPDDQQHDSEPLRAANGEYARPMTEAAHE